MMKRWAGLLWIVPWILSCPTRAVMADDPPRPIRALLVLGGCCHDYAQQKDILTRGISARAHVEWTVAYDPDTTNGHKNPIYDNPDWAKGFDVIVHDECSSQVQGHGRRSRRSSSRTRTGCPASSSTAACTATAPRAGTGRSPRRGCSSPA